MVRIVDDELILSPSDLTGFAACAHLTQLELQAVRGDVERPERNDPLLDVLSRRGAEHEQEQLAKQHASAGSGRVVTISKETKTRADLLARAAETEAAMRDGVDVIYQAVFVNGRWAGYADFVWKVDRPSPNLGHWSYEVADAKLARSVKAAAVLQCCAYSDAIAQIQGVEPEQLHVITGDGETHSFRVADYSAYYRRQKADLEAIVLGGVKASDITLDTYPDPVDHCRICRWAEPCRTRRRADDHLSLVAGMSRSQTRRLTDAGITTRRALAAAAADGRPPRMADATYEKLRCQAALQVKGERTTPPLYELLPVVVPEPDPENPYADLRPRGLAALPEPSPGDLFLDLEGDPYVEGGLEYLFGITDVAADGTPQYRAFWGHDRAEEKAAFEAVIDFITERRAQDENMHVYHYAPYEPSAIRRLMGTHGTREAEVDALLRGELFVDLYQVVRHSVRLSTESYSLKQVEKLYMQRPPGEVMDAGSSIVAYEKWLLDPSQDQLDAIELYNKDDCDSTLGLRTWLETRRAEVEVAAGPIPRPITEERDTAELDERLAEVDAVAEELAAGVPVDVAARSSGEHARWLLAQLLHWHRREEKPAWWRYFDRCRAERTTEEFIDDRECIGGLEYRGVVDKVKSSLVHRYGFEAQDHKFDVDATPDDPVTQSGAGVVVEVGDDFIDLKRGAKSPKPHPSALIPGGPFNTTEQRAALLEVGRWVRDHGIEAPGAHQAARDLLMRQGPRLRTGQGAPLVRADERPLRAACRLVLELDGGCLAIQGPPGAGKTYTGAQMVLALLEDGRRVGVTAQSHAVISNFICAVMDEAKKQGVEVAAIQRATEEEDHCGRDGVARARSNAAVLDALEVGEPLLVGGTSWLWCDPDMRNAVDVLFVDEAGQRSLADVAAVSVAATNLVLLGDPQQLAQVSQGSHPEGAEKSALAYLLDDHATMPDDRGLFLDTTFRMHPSVCEFISEVVYEGKLHSKPGLDLQLVSGNGLVGGAGLRYVPIAHAGNTTSSREEAEAVADLFRAAVGRLWTDAKGRSRELTNNDVLVVAPYNAQVAELRRHLPDGAKVGTVDKFQGQEAPVTIYSMASSTAEDAPRGMDFLYDLHRLNVAVSRARSLSIVVCSPELPRVMCRTPAQMRLVNAVCRNIEMAL